LGVLGNLYSGTFKCFAATFPGGLPKSLQMISHVAHKTFQNPLGKGWKTYPTAFSMQYLGKPNVVLYPFSFQNLTAISDSPSIADNITKALPSFQGKAFHLTHPRLNITLLIPFYIF
jgi:hypothetical protein